MSPLQDRMSKLILMTLVLPLTLASTALHPYAPQCCPGGGNLHLDAVKNCSNGVSLQLNCTAFLVELDLEPENTIRFSLDASNRSWLIFDGSGAYNVSPDRYCVSQLQENGKDAMLVCFPDQVESHPVWQSMFFGMFSMVSSIFLAVTLLVYLVLPELREVQDKAMMSMMFAFMISFFLNSNMQLSSWLLRDDFTCILMAFIMYYAYMCAFFWLNIISLNIWKSVWFPSFKVHSSVLFAFYSAIGWGLPLGFLALSLISHHFEQYRILKPGFGETSCWFNGRFATWTYFYGPVLVLLSMNLTYLTLTGWKLWHQYKDLSCCKLKVLRLRCLMCIKLALLMGFTWIFEIISYAIGGTEHYYWIIPDALNALQGFLVFIILVVCRKRVRKLLAQRKPFNIPFPKSWAAYADLENCEPVGPEELELSQSS